ncbi:lysophospholipid acyltransferase family protein [Methylocucumis oryzae]|uniref:Acyltransferase n=1 Tax=Methylocucumis oryzae TaxID=1632867 RepID=A0A0F3IF49_9GAMM|nr:lysophospholipid acyltransferase family protein [Methylocucumis oryzae]KJV05386.1 acyltransferase [Methylocucumis oryzae]
MLATGWSFSVFGIGGFLLWVLVFPILGLLPGDAKAKRQRAQKCVHHSFAIFISMMCKLGIMTYEINGLEKLNRPGQLILANHPTLIDIVFLLSRIPYASCIVKSQLCKNPCMRGSIAYAGYISNEDPETMIVQCVEYLRAGGIMIIFPESTRTVPGVDYKFYRGAAAIALQANTQVTPVILQCVPSTLTKAEKWFEIPERKFHLSMRVNDDIILKDFVEITPKSVAVRRFNTYLKEYFTQYREFHERNGR